MRDYVEFFKQFRQRFHTTGAIAPSSRFLARAMTGPLRKRKSAARVLEIGPGTGAVTRHIVHSLTLEDHFDLVEINEAFAGMLRSRFENDADYCRVAEISDIHTKPLQEFSVDEPYDFIISGLPLNNFSPELVQEIFESYFRLLAPGGVLSYFEYMFVRGVRKRMSGKSERQRFRSLESIILPYLKEQRMRTSWVFPNFPPAWVQHLRDSSPIATDITAS